MQTDFVLDALEQALYARRHEREGALVHHGERGSQYVSIRCSERLSQAGIEPSVGSTGDSYDNALAETINGLFKAEIIHRRGPWKTREAVELATLEWVSWFNHHRLLKSIGYIPPAEDEANYWAATRPGPDDEPATPDGPHIAGRSNHEYMAQPGGLRRPLRGADGRKIQQPSIHLDDQASPALLKPTGLFESRGGSDPRSEVGGDDGAPTTGQDLAVGGGAARALGLAKGRGGLGQQERTHPAGRDDARRGLRRQPPECQAGGRVNMPQH
jgi:hypothetical protein